MFCGVEIRQVSNANFLGNDSILHRRRELYGLGYIGGLRRFVAAAEHYDQCFTTLNVLHAPFRAKMFAHLDDAVTDRLYIAQLSHHRLTQANIQPLPGDPVFQAIKPSRKSFGTFDRVHGQAVVVWLHTVKCSNSKVSSGLNECKLKGKSEKGPLAPFDSCRPIAQDKQETSPPRFNSTLPQAAPTTAATRRRPRFRTIPSPD